MPKQSASWLHIFDEITPIRRVGLFYLYRATLDGAPRVVAVSRPDVDPEWAGRITRQVAEHHRRCAHPNVPKVSEMGHWDDGCYIAFACDAAIDFARVFDDLDGLSSAALSAFVEICADVMASYRRIGAPVPRLSGLNMLVQRDGQLALIGLASDLLRGQGDGLPLLVEVPEQTDGRTPQPETVESGLLGRLVEALAPADIGTPLSRRLELGARGLEPELVDRWGDHWGQCLADAPEDRYPTLDALLSESRWLWQQVDSTPDQAALCAELSPWAAPERTPAPGKTIGGRYRLESRIGFGRRASFYLAWDLALEHSVVIKWADPADSDDRARARLLREVSILRRLRHENIVGGFDVVLDGERIGVVMEFVAGESLADQLHRTEDRKALAASLSGIADALDYLRSQSIVHRDIKPANIRLHPQRGAVLVDLGLARGIEDAHAITRPQELLGTWRYMSPEQTLGRKATMASDTYAFCVVLLDVLLGANTRPDDDDILASLKGVGVPLFSALVIARGLSKTASERPRPEELAEALRRLVGDDSPEAERLVWSDGLLEMGSRGTADLRRRRTLRRVLNALIQAHRRGPDGLTLEALLSQGWPDQNPIRETGRARVYTAMSTLRREHGLGTLIQRHGEGYRLSPDVAVVIG